MRRRRVYVASRMTNGGHELGYDIHAIRDAIIVSAKLQQAGYAPFCPQLTMLAEMIYPIPYESWLGLDFEWVEACDVVFRIENESKGADREVIHANKVGTPVYFSRAIQIGVESDIASFISRFPPEVESEALYATTN